MATSRRPILSSLIALGNRVVMWFDDANYQGPRKTAEPQRGLNFGTSNDKISSACFEGYCK
jgi:hypothetical protein